MFSQAWPESDVRSRWRRLLDLLAPQPGDHVLDVGFGRGQALQTVARLVAPGGRALGIETSTRFLANARSSWRIGSGFAPEVPAASADQLPFAERTIDRVLSVNVLEAIPDPLAAILEMCRVLRLGGRYVIAHDDYESLVFSGADPDLTRRIVGAFSRATLEGYATSDGQMGRKLPGLLRQAGLRIGTMEPAPLVNTEFRSGLHGWDIAHLACDVVQGHDGITAADCDRWLAELEQASEFGSYLYCLNLYVCAGQR